MFVCVLCLLYLMLQRSLDCSFVNVPSIFSYVSLHSIIKFKAPIWYGVPVRYRVANYGSNYPSLFVISIGIDVVV